jgi:ABC-type sugar transport system permease subunit
MFTGDAPEEAALEGSKGSYFRSQWRDGVLCALPWLVGFVVFTGGPLLFSIVISFCQFDILNPAVFTGLKNYIFMVNQRRVVLEVAVEHAVHGRRHPARPRVEPRARACC